MKKNSIKIVMHILVAKNTKTINRVVKYCFIVEMNFFCFFVFGLFELPFIL